MSGVQSFPGTVIIERSGALILDAYNGSGGPARFNSNGQLVTDGAAASLLQGVLAADVACNNTALYFDGPTVNAGNTGTWFVSGTVTLYDNSVGANVWDAKLWDGTTVIASGRTVTTNTNTFITLSLQGFITNPAGLLRISAIDLVTINGIIRANSSGNAKDSSISAMRVA